MFVIVYLTGVSTYSRKSKITLRGPFSWIGGSSWTSKLSATLTTSPDVSDRSTKLKKSMVELN